MTSLAPNTIPSAPSSTPQASSNTPSAHSGSQSTSGQSSTIAAATAGSRPTQVLYAQAAKKSSYTPAIVSSTVGSSPPVVGGAPGSNARTSNASPVNGKNQVAPAVPTVTSAMSSVIVNGTSGPSNGHGRKPSVVSGGNGGNAWMQNGNPQANRLQQNNQQPIRFGSFPPDQSMQPVPGSAPVSSPNLSAPAVPNPRISSPQMSPSPLPQPAVSGGPLTQGMQNQNIQFGAWGNVADRGDQRQMHRPTSMPIPPVPPSQGAGHMRRESSNSHQQHPEIPQTGMGSNRGGMQGNNRRNQGPPFGGQNTYQPGYNNHNNYNNRNAPNQSRGSGYQAPPINPPHYPNVQGGNYHQSPRQPPRSPAMHHNIPHPQPVHSLPGTPQLGTVQIANSPSFQPAYPTVHQQQLYPSTQQPYDPNIYHAPYPHMHPYGQYPGAPPASPRNQFAPLNPNPYMNMSMGFVAPPTMTRSPSSTAPDINRPPSGFGVPHTPMISPTPPINPNFFKKPEKSKSVKISRPDGTPVDLGAGPLETPKPKPVVVSSSPSPSPLIVSSGNPPPRPAATETKKSANEIRQDMALQVQKSIKETEARELELKKAEEERSKREAKEAEEKKRKEEEEKKRKEEEEEQLRKEAEEKARLEEEERIRKEAEAARIAKEKAEEEARIAKEKEEEEIRRKEDEERRIREEVERRLKEEEAKRKAAEEERLRKEAEEKARLEEEERIRKEAEAARIAKEKAEEEARIAKEKEEAEKRRREEEAAEAAAAAAAKSAEALAEDTVQQTKPEPAEQVSSPQPPPTTDEATRPTKPRGSKPSPLVINNKTTEPGPPSAALTALRSARFIGDINSVRYPDNILSPNPALNSAAPAGKFKYQKDFLLQFQNVFTEKPSVDWDQIIRDSVGEPTDSARPSTSSKMSAGGLGGRSASRPGATSVQPPMGSMGSMGPMGGFGTGKFGLPPNMLSSAQRFEQSNSRTISSNPLAAVGQFRAGPPISRTNSSQGLPQQGGALPQSPRIRSQRGERGTSKRGNTAGGVAMEKSESKQAEPKPVLTIPPSDVKPLVVSETRWKPRTVQAAASTGAAPGVLSAVAPPVPTEDNKLSPEMVQRKVKAALNKMTPEKFDKIAGQILDIASQSKYETDGRTLRQVIQLTFEKATDEAAWSSMYAKFCKVMMESMDPNIKDENIKDLRTGKVVTGGILFRKYLLNRCQEEFQRGWKVNLPPKPEGEADEAAMLSDEYYIAAAAKRRGLGLIQFIGELFKLGMLTERIMQECVKKLVDYEGVPEEAEVESLCKLLRTIGAVLDGTEKSRPSMDAYFDRIQTMINHPDVQSRLKFMLMDIVDLRKKNWEVNEVDKGPKTLAEIQADVAKAAAEKEAISRANAQRGPRATGGRNDGRSYSQGGNYGQSDYQRQMAQNTINSDDLRKLKQRNDRNQNAGQSTLGPPTMFGARGSNPKRGGMGPPSFNRGDDSGPTSRTATPPAGTTTSRNSFGVLGDMGSQANDGDANDSISPAPSAASSPPLAKATPVMRSLSGME